MSVIKFYKDNLRGVGKYLRNNVCDINELDRNGHFTALHLACKRIDYETIKVLLEYNADVNAKNWLGETPLHVFLNHYNVNDQPALFEVLNTLLKHNADINALDNSGKSPVTIACSFDEFLIIETLFQLHAYLGDDDNNSVSSKETTDENREIEMFTTSIKFDALVRWRDLEGKTMLHIAADQLHYFIFRDLLVVGADINSVSYNNKTPLDYIRQKEHVDRDSEYRYLVIYRVLREHVIKLKCAKLKVAKTNIDIVYNDPEFKQKIAQLEAKFAFLGNESVDTSPLENQCMEEIRKLQTITCGYVSVYEFVTNNIHDLSRLTVNKDFNKLMYSLKFFQEFPLYIGIIRNRWRRGCGRYYLLRPAAKYSHDTIFQRLTPNIVHEILRYLSIEDLKIFISAFGDFQTLVSQNNV